MALNDTQESERLASMEDQYNDEDRHSVDMNDNWDEPSQEMVWHFHDLKGGAHQVVSSIQAIRGFCTKYNVYEPGTFVAAQSIIEDRISSIPGVAEVTHQLAQVRKTCETHERKYEAEVSLLTDIATQHTLIQQKTADTLAHASGIVVSLARFLRKARDETRSMSCKHWE